MVTASTLVLITTPRAGKADGSKRERRRKREGKRRRRREREGERKYVLPLHIVGFRKCGHSACLYHAFSV